MKTILSACRGIENLWFFCGDGEEASQIIEGLFLKHLYCYLHEIFGSHLKIDFTHPIFAQITHLRILDSWFPDGIDLEIWGGLALIPHLTHLCFDDKAFLPLCLTLLHTCISLRVLVVLDASLVVHLEEPPLVNDKPALLKDPRFVFMSCARYAQDW
ncbi:hypothetical protein DFH09DRAFT_1378859 [Mycena vulgaris]|nr:hypothetical protein DFH09DRAFT_1378859 [Mycena vulgaris]